MIRNGEINGMFVQSKVRLHGWFWSYASRSFVRIKALASVRCRMKKIMPLPKYKIRPPIKCTIDTTSSSLFSRRDTLGAFLARYKAEKRTHKRKETPVSRLFSVFHRMTAPAYDRRSYLRPYLDVLAPPQIANRF